MQAAITERLAQIPLPRLPARLPAPLASRPVLAAAAALAGAATVYGANRLLDDWVQGNAVLGRTAAATGWKWDKEVVLITGGSSGMGKIMACEFAQRDIKVVVLDVRPPADDAPLPEAVTFYQVDITDDVQLHEVAEKVRADVGNPTVLINNAGVGHGQSLLDTTPAAARRVFAVNALAPLLTIREFVPAMVAANHGHVVTMASMASFVVVADNVDYCCSKAAVLALHEGLRLELKHRYNADAVRTTTVHPYWVQTPLLGDLVHSKNFSDIVLSPEQVATAVVQQVLSGRSGQLIMPAWFGVAALARGFPTWVQELLRGYKSKKPKE